MAARGLSEFEVDGRGNVVAGADNLERLRRLFRDSQIIDGEFGPGNPGDFDNGSWHILCHLAGGTGVVRVGADIHWLAITHDAANDRYRPTATFRAGGGIATKAFSEAGVLDRLSQGRLLGFVEGSSVGHIFARGVQDPRTAFNGWPRQDFDRDPADGSDGGTVWEHWCTTRDIRASSAIGDSVLGAYLALVSVLGGRFVAAVARGRREHEHPRHLAALVKAGLLDKQEALWATSPVAIAPAAEQLLLEARPEASLAAVEQLAWDDGEPRYYMFDRRIGKWSTSAAVQRDLVHYGVR